MSQEGSHFTDNSKDFGLTDTEMRIDGGPEQMETDQENIQMVPTLSDSGVAPEMTEQNIQPSKNKKNQQKHRMQMKLKSLEEEIDRLKQEKNETKRVQIDLKSLEEDNIRMVQNEWVMIKEQKFPNQPADAFVMSLHKENVELQKQLNVVKEQALSQDSLNKELQKVGAEKENEIKRLKQALQQSEENLRKEQERLKNFEDAYRQQQVVNERFKSEITRLQPFEQSHQQIQINMQKCVHDVDEANKITHNIRQEHSDLKSEKKDLLMNLRKEQERLENFEDASRQLQIVNESLNSEITRLQPFEQSHRDMQINMQRCLHDVDETNKITHNIRQENSDLKSEKKNLVMSLRKEQERLKNFEDAYRQLQVVNGSLNSEINRLQPFEQSHRDMQINMQKCLHDVDETNKITHNIRQENSDLKSEKKNLLMRLSKVAGDNLSFKNPNIADLSDAKRPTKLSEEFSEMYDNEWTDAFEIVTIQDEEEKTAYMLGILRRANELCNGVSANHGTEIRRSFSTLVIKTKIPVAVDVTEDTCRAGGVHGDYQETQEEHEPTQVANKTPEQQDEGGDHANGSIHNLAKQINTTTQYVALETPGSEDEKNTGKVIYLDADFSKLNLTNEQQKTVFDMRKYFESILTEEFEKVATNTIANEYGVNPQKQDAVIRYIQKCVSICWSMCRHEPPVHVEFQDVGDNIQFDTNAYKAYTKTGKYIDFIVWPALRLHQGGPMLCKGVAQGKLK